jgi:hypothetical protein
MQDQLASSQVRSQYGPLIPTPDALLSLPLWSSKLSPARGSRARRSDWGKHLGPA